MAEIHKDDIGTIFELTVKDDTGTIVDVTTATSVVIYFIPPSGVASTKTATVYNGPLGLIRYTSIAGDLAETGNYKLQGKITMPAGAWYTDIHSFKVYANLV